MTDAVSLDEELFRVPSETEYFSVTGPELFLVHGRRLICVHVRLARARAGTCARLILVYLLSATLNVRLSTYVRAGLRFCLFVALIRRGTHLLPLCGCSSLRLFRLRIRLLLIRLLLVRRLAQGHKRQCHCRYCC